MMGQSADPRTTGGSRDSSVSTTEEDTLSEPGRLFTYDFGAYDPSGEPVSVKTTEQVHHVHSPCNPTDPGETVEYSDGMGRTVQTGVQAEELDFGEAGPTRSTVGDAVGSSVRVPLPQQTSLSTAVAALKRRHFLYRTQFKGVLKSCNRLRNIPRLNGLSNQNIAWLE
jgi:hypothetical protein